MVDTSAVEPGGTTVGALLAATRQAKGVTLDEVARATRIGKNYLLSLEADAFDKLPSPAYVKGFLRVYADYLGLVPDRLVALYEQTLTPAAPGPDDQRAAEPQGARTIAPPRNRWTIPLVLLGLVVFSAYLLRDREEGHVRKSAAPAPAAVSAPAVSVQPRISSATTPASLPAAPAAEPAAQSAETAAPASSTSGIVLRLKVNQDCWLNITIDGALSQQYDLKAGDLIEWKGERSFALDLGNAGGVEAELNGKPLPAFGDAGQTAHVRLDAEGVEDQQ